MTPTTMEIIAMRLAKLPGVTVEDAKPQNSLRTECNVPYGEQDKNVYRRGLLDWCERTIADYANCKIFLESEKAGNFYRLRMWIAGELENHD